MKGKSRLKAELTERSRQKVSSGRYVGSELETFRHARRWKRYFASELRRHIRGDVLEVGAGIGATTAVLRHAKVSSWTSIEPDVRLLFQMGARRQSDSLRAKLLLLGGSLAIFGRRQTFDTILYIDVLEHIQDDRKELEEAAARLRPGGRLIVLAPGHAWLFSVFDEAVGHFRRYSARTLTAAAPKELELCCLYHLDSVGVLASLGNRLLLKSALPSLRQIQFWDSWMIPLSCFLDRVTFGRFGRSIVGVWAKAVRT